MTETPGTAQPAERGVFLEPDPGLVDVENLHERLGIDIKSGHRADIRPFATTSPVLAAIADAIETSDVVYEDQCSAKHYADVFACVQEFCGVEAGSGPEPRTWDRLRSRIRRFTGPKLEETARRRVVDVGVFMGGSANIFAGCVGPYDVDLDLVDTNRNFLQFTYERLRRMYPESIGRVRMFWGDVPTYVQRVVLPDRVQTFVHHDGAHDFSQVVKDLSSLFFVRDTVSALAVQDTHLRCSDLQYECFVDAAVFAVFGPEVKYRPIGTVYEAESPVTAPNRWLGNYFLPGVSEGMHIQLAQNDFRFPHPSMSLEVFLPEESR